MSAQSYVSFLVAALVLVYSPGPVNALTMGEAVRAGWRAALPCVWGGTCAVLLQLVFTACCLNSMLLVSTHALEFMRWAGAAYLVYLGYKQWRGTGLTGAQPAENARRGLFWRGFATSGLNPKTLLFFPSFFPQFISTESPWSASEQYLALAATFTLIFVLGVSSMALFSHRLGAVLQRPLCMKAFNRVSSALLVGMGVLLAGVR